MDNPTLRFCVLCGTPFQATNSWHKYCSDKCRITTGISRKHRTLETGRYCRQCGKHFFPDFKTGKNQQHCSIECAKKSAKECRSKFWEKLGDKRKEKRDAYYANNRAKCGTDSNLKRFYARFPDAPKACQSCGESRVLDIAHKPSYKRNGSWPAIKNTTIESCWILCPTCHALIDRKGYDPADLGLSP